MDQKQILDRLKKIDKEIESHEDTINNSLSKMKECEDNIKSSCSELTSLNYEKVQLLNYSFSNTFNIPKI